MSLIEDARPCYDRDRSAQIQECLGIEDCVAPGVVLPHKEGHRFVFGEERAVKLFRHSDFGRAVQRLYVRIEENIGGTTVSKGPDQEGRGQGNVLHERRGRNCGKQFPCLDPALDSLLKGVLFLAKILGRVRFLYIRSLRSSRNARASCSC